MVQGPPIGVGPLGPEFRVIEDFGTVKLDEDKTLEAGVSFCDGNGGGGTKILLATGGPLPFTIGIGASLIAGGQLARRIFR